MSSDRPKDDNLVGQVLLHYQVTDRLGAGGMGVVYRATDLKLQRTVALKFLPESQAVSRDVKERFMREALASSALDHTNIGTLYAVEETTDGQLFLVMACYEGPTLAEKMAHGPIPAGEATDIALQICRGLQAAHERGVIHRDIKPGNLIFNSQGVLKILDFGLAKLHGSPDLTMPGSTLGTAAYMAPEQALGNSVDHRADIWAAGVVLYEMLAGRPLFRSSDLRSTLYAVISKPPEPLVGVSSGLDRVIRKALQKDPGDRYQTAGEMIAGLDRALAPQAPPDSEDVTLPAIAAEKPVAVPAQTRSKGLRRGLAAAAAVLLLSTAAVAFWFYHRRLQTAPAGMRVAALPLLVTGSDETGGAAPSQALADGIRLQLIDALSSRERSNPGLLVIPASLIASQNVTDPADARRALGANLAITGSLAISGNNIRVVLSSIDTATSKVLKSEVTEGAQNAMADLSKQLAQSAAAMLGLKTAASTVAADPTAGLPPGEAGTFVASLGYLEHWDKSASLDAAIAGFGQVVKASPNFAPGYAALADCYRRRYQSTKDAQALELAEQNVGRAVQLQPNLPGVELSFGEVQSLEGNYSVAISAFERVLALDDRNDRAWRGLAKAYAAMGLPDKAQQTWEKAVALQPNSAENHNQLALFEMNRGDYAKAAAEFRQSLALAPENVNIMSNLGVALLYAGSLDESRKVLQDSIRLAPSYASYTNLGNLDLKQARYADAAADYEKALEINKSDYRVWSNLAVAYSRTPGQKERAKDGFLQAAKLCREALKTNPNDPSTLSDLAMFVASEGDERQEPLVLIEKALALAPEDTYVQFNAVETYESLGYRKEALDWVARLVASGYPLDDIDESPVLADLVKDKRYQVIAQTRKK
jgi:eukaryotic-like serine/threonine-protein kinase